MALNPMQFAVYALALVCCWWGSRLARRKGFSAITLILLVLLAVPGVCYALFYLHLWEEPMWLYRIRAVPGSELLAAPMGLIAGWIQGNLYGRWRVSLPLVMILVLVSACIPYIKQLSGPLELREKWKDGVCLQSTPSTCGPASAATLLGMMGIPTTEAEIARDAFSTSSGTENWYLKRAIEKRGVACRYEWVPAPIKHLHYPSIAGLKLGPHAGHFIAILAEDAEGYLIADPIYGRTHLKRKILEEEWASFSGFFMVLSKPSSR